MTTDKHPDNSHRVLVMRHPETMANIEGFLSGRKDVDLTPAGERQMYRAIDALVAWKPDRIWTSPLSRCKSIAEEAAHRLGIECEVHQNLVEFEFGIGQGLTIGQLQELGYTFPWKIDENGHSIACPGGETYEELYARGAALLDELAPLTGRTACVTHGGFSRGLLGSMFKIPFDTFWRMNLPNVSSMVLTYVMGGFSLAALSLAPEEVIRRSEHPELVGKDTTEQIKEG